MGHLEVLFNLSFIVQVGRRRVGSRIWMERENGEGDSTRKTVMIHDAF
jgi:hypothetical protein